MTDLVHAKVVEDSAIPICDEHHLPISDEERVVIVQSCHTA